MHTYIYTHIHTSVYRARSRFFTWKEWEKSQRTIDRWTILCFCSIKIIIYIHMYKYIYIYTHIYTYTYIYIYRQVGVARQVQILHREKIKERQIYLSIDLYQSMYLFIHLDGLQDRYTNRRNNVYICYCAPASWRGQVDLGKHPRVYIYTYTYRQM